MVLGSLLGWNWKVRRLRKKWDRLREKTLKKKEPIRKTALEKLDRLEDTLRILEEQRLSRMDKSRMSKELEIGLAEVKGLLQTKPEEFRALRKSDNNLK
jgi:hypothetical protein